MRALSTPIVDAIQSRAVKIEYFYRGVFTGGTLRLWTGTGNKVLFGETYLGNGWLLGVGGIKEVLAAQAQGIVIGLSGVPATILSIVLNENSSNVSGDFYIAWLDSNNEIIGSEIVFSGDLDDISIKETPNSSDVTLAYESRLIRLKNKREYRWSDAGHKAEYPTDKGFEYLTQIKSRRIYWGRPDATRKS